MHESQDKFCVTLFQDALLDEEGAQPQDGFGSGANVVSFKPPAAQAALERDIKGAQDAHEARLTFAFAQIYGSMECYMQETF